LQIIKFVDEYMGGVLLSVDYYEITLAQYHQRERERFVYMAAVVVT
jgi:hypothetical protein